MTSTLPRLRPLEILRLPEENGGSSYVLRDPEGYSDEELIKMLKDATAAQRERANQ